MSKDKAAIHQRPKWEGLVILFAVLYNQVLPSEVQYSSCVRAEMFGPWPYERGAH